VSCADYHSFLENVENAIEKKHEGHQCHVLLDVREPTQFEICGLPHSVNIPLRELKERLPELSQLVNSRLKSFAYLRQNARENCATVPDVDRNIWPKMPSKSHGVFPLIPHFTPCSVSVLAVFVICRRGIDSVAASDLLVSCGVAPVFDVAGGLTKWSTDVDPEFPRY
jgi:adenylyltransferase/sulfurtransferase